MKNSKKAEKHVNGPQTIEKSGPGPFKGSRAGEKRAGSTKYVDYPDESMGSPNYKGAVGDCK